MCLLLFYNCLIYENMFCQMLFGHCPLPCLALLIWLTWSEWIISVSPAPQQRRRLGNFCRGTDRLCLFLNLKIKTLFTEVNLEKFSYVVTRSDANLQTIRSARQILWIKMAVEGGTNYKVPWQFCKHIFLYISPHQVPSLPHYELIQVNPPDNTKNIPSFKTSSLPSDHHG